MVGPIVGHHSVVWCICVGPIVAIVANFRLELLSETTILAGALFGAYCGDCGKF